MNGIGFQIALLASAIIAAGLAGIRWLRVAQREHYLAGSVLLFARRWWSTGPNRLLGAAAVVGLIGAALKVTPAGLVAVAAVAVGPFGLGLKGRTSALVWTRRLKVLAATSAAFAAVWIVLALALGHSWAVAAAIATFAAVLSPQIVDVALYLTKPLERRLGRPFVERAATKLASVGPTVVAITGSYGKTTTKGYVAHLVSGSLTVVATPKSYNNQSGLSRAINEQLLPATDVFVAEMGTYGLGEIAEMCSWVTPDIAVITAIGPVHLERMRSEAEITLAKAEILQQAKVAVLNVDSTWLAPLADQVAAGGKKLWRCSAVDRRADVCVVRDEAALRAFIHAAEGRVRQIAVVKDLDVSPTNVACAIAVALELGIAPEVIGRRLPTLPGAPHRRQVEESQAGATIIDDTYNANPAGAAAALRLLADLAADRDGSGVDRGRCGADRGRSGSDRDGSGVDRDGSAGARGRSDGQAGQHLRVVITPGMVELGARQADENAHFAEQAARIATHLVVVGQTNAKALLAGWRRVPEAERAKLVRCSNRAEAVRWVATRLGPGDVVLYENDLPDHYP